MTPSPFCADVIYGSAERKRLAGNERLVRPPFYREHCTFRSSASDRLPTKFVLHSCPPVRLLLRSFPLLFLLHCCSHLPPNYDIRKVAPFSLLFLLTTITRYRRLKKEQARKLTHAKRDVVVCPPRCSTGLVSRLFPLMKCKFSRRLPIMTFSLCEIPCSASFWSR